MGRRGLLLAVVLTGLIAGPAQGEAQQRCDPTGTERARGAGSVIYLTLARLRCTDMTIRADSATLYQDSDAYQLFGRVTIDTPEVRLQSRDAQYYPDQGMITAQGNVRLLRKADSTSISNGEMLTLFRAGTLGRTEDALTVEGGRPHAVIRPQPADSADPDSVASEPFEIDADRIEVRGQREVHARGRVELRREDLDARADTLNYVSDSGQLLLTGSASIDVETQLLTGGLILVTMADDEIQDILARRGARLTGDLDIEGGFIQLELTEGELESVTVGADAEVDSAPAGAAALPTGARAGLPTPTDAPPDSVAPPTQAKAASEDFTITGARLDIDLTRGELERVDARGQARLVTYTADSLNTDETPEVARSDWIEGDTINVLFARSDSASDAGVMPSPDTTAVVPDSVVADQQAEPDSADARPRLDVLIARVNARALYRLPAADTANAGNPACSGPGRFAVHYVIGDSITITMKDNEVDEMNVVGQVFGQHLEPPACVPPTDTTAAPAAPPVPTDTTASARPSAGAPSGPAGGAPPPPPGADGEVAALPKRTASTPSGTTRRRARPEPPYRR